MPRIPYEREEHGDNCKFGDHMRYRVRTASWVEVRCKVCKHVDIELYEHSVLNPRETTSKEVAA